VKLTPTLGWRFDSSGRALDVRLLPLLEGIAKHGSLSAAVRHLELSYRAAWGLLRDYEALLGTPLVDFARGHAAALAPAGLRLVQAQRNALTRFDALAQELTVDIGAARLPQRAPQQASLRMVASHDLALAAVRDTLPASTGLALDVAFMGSIAALEAYGAGNADVAGFHVPIAGRRTAHHDAEPFRALLRARRDRIIGFVEREQGLMLARAQARHVRSFRDIAARGLVFVNRQRGSGTRLIIDALLRREGIPAASIRGYATEEFTHAAIAATVASGGADAGFGLRAAAEEYDLGFVPLMREKYHLAVRASALRSPAVVALLAYLQSSAFSSIVQRLPGYRAASPGTVSTVDSL